MCCPPHLFLAYHKMEVSREEQYSVIRILFPLKAYSLWNLFKAAASVRWRCTTRQCWLNFTSTLQRNGHNFIGLDADFIMTTHSLTSCSFWLNLTLLPYSTNLTPCDFFLFPSLKTKLQGTRFETSEAVLKKSEAILKDLAKNGLHHGFEEWQQRCKKCIQQGGGVLWKIPCKHWAWAIKRLWKKISLSLCWSAKVFLPEHFFRMFICGPQVGNPWSTLATKEKYTSKSIILKLDIIFIQ